MHDLPEGAGAPEALLASVEQGAASGAVVPPGDEEPPLGAAAARALAELLHDGPSAGPAHPAGGWRALVADVHGRAAELVLRYPASWTLATSSAVLVDDWVQGGRWASALRTALEQEAAGAGALRDAPVVVALHLFALRPHVAAGPEATQLGSPLSSYPHVTRLRALLSCDGPAGEPGGAAALEAVLTAVGRLLR